MTHFTCLAARASCSRQGARGRAFTIIEVLVVIGILALLLSLLLPTINEVRRKSRTTKCLSNLRQVGTAFRAYASANEGAWPPAVHHYLSTSIPLPSGQELRWYDRIGPYVTDRKMINYNDIRILRFDSVVWGCPEYAKAIDLRTSDPRINPNATNDELRPGYGMNYQPFADRGLAGQPLAYFSSTTGTRGRYLRQEQWTKQADRGLVADSPAHIIEWPNPLSQSSRWSPYNTPFASGDFYVDVRHANTGRSDKDKSESYSKIPGIGMLFCDGHADLVTVREAWIAFRNPGGADPNALPPP